MPAMSVEKRLTFVDAAATVILSGSRERIRPREDQKLPIKKSMERNRFKRMFGNFRHRMASIRPAGFMRIYPSKTGKKAQKSCLAENINRK
jgi:hypothetical protein